MAAYGWGLSAAMQEKARRELNETSAATRATAVQLVRSQIVTRPDIVFLRTDTAFIVRFLRARKFDPSAAFRLYARYFEYRAHHGALFRAFRATEPRLKAALLDGFPCVIGPPGGVGGAAGGDGDGTTTTIIVLFASNWDQKAYQLIDIYRAVLLSLEKLIDNEIVQVNGFVVVVDWTGFSLSQAACIQPQTWRLIIEGLQECFPARFTAIHFVHQPWFVEAAFKLMKPFLKGKTKDKIHMNGNNLAKLHADIPSERLPADLGGHAPPCHLQAWAQTLIGDDGGFCFGEEEIYWPDGGGSIKTRSKTYPQDLFTAAGKRKESRCTLLDEESFLIE